MKRVLLLSFSPHGSAARSFQLARDLLREHLPDATIIERDYGSTPAAPISREYAMAVTTRALPDPGAVSISEQLINEVEACDLLILCTPLHNFTVPATLKIWIDQVVRIQRSFAINERQEKIGLLEDTPTWVLVSSGGAIKGHPAHQADFLSPYLRVILGTVGIHSVEFVYLASLLHGEQSAEQSLAQARAQLSDLLRYSV
ncbi:NAD(P)H-dependent oxidoreductase [Pseudomonas sp. SZMC_28357]|uniref:FMN-dependent NADH-azoreductase n=1 Tax=Pseudomonas sp. SZMC_28357 TaxID=3074380 RepID=UPI0028725668|nr:NAD(P)H-dependent oxidoreductase [Pseudomonas sp. SZMC_28357]MDR9750260.1 NAD(P)H-dependent oxidoreductase [Pseudomonas sp. SZMC_28357]